MKELSMTAGQVIRCRGKNGSFNLDRIEAWGFDSGEIYVEFFSNSKTARQSPMYIQGTKEDLRSLFAQLLGLTL